MPAPSRGGFPTFSDSTVIWSPAYAAMPHSWPVTVVALPQSAHKAWLAGMPFSLDERLIRETRDERHIICRGSRPR
jgi:hypothetical protein